MKTYEELSRVPETNEEIKVIRLGCISTERYVQAVGKKGVVLEILDTFETYIEIDHREFLFSTSEIGPINQQLTEEQTMSNMTDYNLLYDPPEEIKPIQVRIPDKHGMKVEKVDPSKIKERCVSCHFSAACGVIDCVKCTQGILDGALNSKHGCNLISGIRNGKTRRLNVTNCSTVVGEEVISNIPAEENNSIQEEKTSADPNNLIGNIYQSRYSGSYIRVLEERRPGVFHVCYYCNLQDALNKTNKHDFGEFTRENINRLVNTTQKWTFIQNAADSKQQSIRVGDEFRGTISCQLYKITAIAGNQMSLKCLSNNSAWHGPVDQFKLELDQGLYIPLQ